MKLTKSLSIAFILTLCLNSINAQEADSILVEKAVLNYIENFFENNFEAMNESLHPRLSKRGFNPDRTIYKDLPPSELKKMMASKNALPLKAQKNKVTNIKIFHDVATANLNTGYPNVRWVEFCHLVRIDGEWKIIDVFWEYFK